MAVDNQKCFCRVSYIGHLDLATFSTVFHFVVNLFVASIGTFFFFFLSNLHQIWCIQCPVHMYTGISSQWAFTVCAASLANLNLGDVLCHIGVFDFTH